MSEGKSYLIDRFLGEIRSRKEDRGYLSKLRRGLSSATEEQAWPIIVRQPFDFTDQRLRRIWTVVGALVALLIPDGLCVENYSTMGVVLRKLLGNGASESQTQSYGAKLRRLMNCIDAEELCELAVGVVRMASQKGVEVNCRGLFWDLYGWDDAKKREETRIRWARDFYSFKEEDNG